MAHQKGSPDDIDVLAFPARSQSDIETVVDDGEPDTRIFPDRELYHRYLRYETDLYVVTNQDPHPMSYQTFCWYMRSMQPQEARARVQEWQMTPLQYFHAIVRSEIGNLIDQ